MAAFAQPTHSGLANRDVSKHPDSHPQRSSKTSSRNGGGPKRTGHQFLCSCVVVPGGNRVANDYQPQNRLSPLNWTGSSMFQITRALWSINHRLATAPAKEGRSTFL